ncbi:DUF1642 domain-containing protein [Listeria booriae]|uniref:DUF1642 domain-containing protein n=1 Tax=Listeria booriae TaxID=1552123 RepID=UPI00162A00CF|nr:DUF1642 domain-containing protein [Listeria booriae]MBC2303401.1 DUF1642 domain-containing protein [Listeria booriae]
MTHKFKVGDRVQVIRDSKIEIDTITFKDGTIYQLQDKSWVEDCRLAPAPALVVIPHDVRDEIVLSLHYHEHDKKKALKYMLKLYYRNPELYDESVRKWIEGNFTQFISAFLVGYTTVEVEKEPLYYVQLPYLTWDDYSADLKTNWAYLQHDFTSDETRMVPTTTEFPSSDFKSRLSEKTIKEIDERYWQFAVPVEGVSE